MYLLRRLGLVWLPLFLFLFFLPLPAAHAAEGKPVITADSAILIDGSTGRVIWAKNPDEQRYPASMTKMMTCLLALQSLRMHELVPISANAAGTEDTPLGIMAGEALEADELINGMMLESDNGAAVALAEKISGSVPAFTDRMNAKAAEIGMKHTHFHNPNGLTDPEHYSTARDMAMLARYAMEQPNFRAIVNQPKRVIRWEVPKAKFLVATNTNELLTSYAGMTGIKTGWTQAAGGCLAASARRSGLELIAVIMHAPDEKSRFSDARAMLDYGFAHVRMVRGMTQAELTRKVWVRGASRATTMVRPASDVNYPIIDDESEQHYTVTYDLPKVLTGPIKDGQVVGHLTVTYDGEPVGTIDLMADGVAPGFSFGGALVRLFAPILELF